MPDIAFHPNDMHRLSRMLFAFRRLSTDPSSGERRTRRSGQGYEFLDYRPYSRGDDVRAIDWNVYGRLRQLFIRVRESPQQASIVFLVDASRSMGFGVPRSKLQQAQLIACGLSFMAMRSGERVFATAFSDTILRLVGPQSGVQQHRRVVRALADTPEARGSNMLQAVHALASQHRNRGMVVILSDFLNVSRVDEVLRVISSAGGRALLVQVLDDRDRAGGLTQGLVQLRDSETGEMRQAWITPQTIRDYKDRFEIAREQLRSRCERKGHFYVLADTTEDYVEVVSRAMRTGAVKR